MEIAAAPPAILAASRKQHDERRRGGVAPPDLFLELEAIADLVRIHELLFVEVDEVVILSHSIFFLLCMWL